MPLSQLSIVILFSWSIFSFIHKIVYRWCYCYCCFRYNIFFGCARTFIVERFRLIRVQYSCIRAYNIFWHCDKPILLFHREDFFIRSHSIKQNKTLNVQSECFLFFFFDQWLNTWLNTVLTVCTIHTYTEKRHRQTYTHREYTIWKSMKNSNIEHFISWMTHQTCSLQIFGSFPILNFISILLFDLFKLKKKK